MIYEEFEAKTLLNALIVGCFFVMALFHLMRLNHYVPASLKGDYQLVAQKVIDRNAEML